MTEKRREPTKDWLNTGRELGYQSCRKAGFEFFDHTGALSTLHSAQERKAIQDTFCLWGQQEQVMVEKAPAKPAPQRGRPKRSPRDQRVHVITLRVPEELLRRLDAYTARYRPLNPTYA